MPAKNTAHQSNLTNLVMCMQASYAEQSCIQFDVRNLHKKKLVQESMTHVQKKLAKFQVKFLAPDS